MRTRSGGLKAQRKTERMSLDELDAEIARCLSRLRYAPNTRHVKTFRKEVSWLESRREALHGIPAAKRVIRARST